MWRPSENGGWWLNPGGLDRPERGADDLCSEAKATPEKGDLLVSGGGEAASPSCRCTLLLVTPPRAMLLLLEAPKAVGGAVITGTRAK